MDNRNDLVSIKVNRVVKRDVDVSHFMNADEYEKLLLLEDNFDSECINDELNCKFRRLPKNLCQAFLGETFWFSLMVVNDSVRDPMSDVVVKIDMTTQNDRTVDIGMIKCAYLDAKQNLNDVLRYEVKEPGSHVMVCTISYKDTNQDHHSFRRYFKFLVNNPLDVKTKFYNAENDEVFLEAQVQNLTDVPICLEKVALEPSQYFNVRELNKIDINSKEQWVFGEVNKFNPRESRQYLYCMTPKPEVKSNVKLLRSVTDVGKIDIVWLTASGVNGRLQTSLLERKSPGYTGIRLIVEAIPSHVNLKEKFDITCRLTNYCDSVVEPAINFNNKGGNQAILWLGVSGKVLGKVNPYETLDFHLTAYPIRSGLQAIPSISVSDVLLKKTYDISDMAYIYVKEES